MQSQKINEIYEYFEKLYGKSPACELNYGSAWELLVAVILSAQCTDKRVNMVTKDLFKKYKTIEDYATANPAEFEVDIHSTGFFRNKTKNILACANEIITKYKGVMPDTIEQLSELPGVGRKTASVVLAEYFKKPAIAVDTHVLRISELLGLSESKNPLKVEEDLAKLWDKQNWGDYHFLTVLFGRYFCQAKKPSCEKCEIKRYCKKCL